MDTNQLVEEILKRVAAKMADLEGMAQPANQSRVLILTEHHGTICHDLLESTKLKDCCHMECALQMDYHCNVEDYDAVVIYNLSNIALSKLAGGMIDTPMITLASKAILSGKRVLIPTEEIELYQYERTAPAAYYTMMCDKLKLLQDSGVIVCPNSELEDILKNGMNEKICVQKCLLKEENVAKGKKYVKIDKKIITEKDIKSVTANDVCGICINCNAILTDLAKEYLNTRRIQVERESSSSRKQG